MSQQSNGNNESFKNGFRIGRMLGMGRFLGFWSVMLILTLDASNGKDLLDVLVPYVEALTISLRG